MCLSLFCIWVEPWLTNAGLFTAVLLVMLRLSTTIVDIGVSVGWLYLWTLTKREFDGGIQTDSEGRESPSADEKPRTHIHPVRSSDVKTTPSVAEGTLVIARKRQFTGAAGKVSVTVDGVSKGGLRPGGSMTLQLPAGSNLVQVGILWVKAQTGVTVLPGQQQSLQVSFNLAGTRLLLKTLSG